MLFDGDKVIILFASNKKEQKIKSNFYLYLAHKVIQNYVLRMIVTCKPFT